MTQFQNSKNNELVLSIVLPSYMNAHILSQRVPLLKEYLNNLGIKFEIIIVDDGSRDQGETQKVTKKLGCIYISNPVNLGKGAAVRLGMLHAQGQFRIFTDADVPYELTTIERFLWYLQFKEYHIVTGDRTLIDSTYFEEVPLIRNLGSRIYSFIVGRFITGGWFDTQCGIKGFRDHVAEDLFSVTRINRFAFDVELLYVALKRNYDIKRLPVRMAYRGESSVRVIYDGLLMMRDLPIILWHYYLNHYRPNKPVHKCIDTYPGSHKVINKSDCNES